MHFAVLISGIICVCVCGGEGGGQEEGAVGWWWVGGGSSALSLIAPSSLRPNITVLAK